VGKECGIERALGCHHNRRIAPILFAHEIQVKTVPLLFCLSFRATKQGTRLGRILKHLIDLHKRVGEGFGAGSLGLDDPKFYCLDIIHCHSSRRIRGYQGGAPGQHLRMTRKHSV
jgi:hypothetical protein